MKKETLQNQLDRKKIFIVRYAYLIISIIAVAITGLLIFFKIDGQSVLSLIVKYYLNR